MNKIKTMLTASVCILLAAQINFEIFVLGFIISVAAIVMSVILYFNRDYNPLIITFSAGIISPLYRGLIIFISNNATNIFELIYSDVLFYFVYGILFYSLYWKNSKATLTNFFTATVISDYFANLLEVSVMLHFRNFKFEIFHTLVLIAFIRSTIAICIILFFQYYNFFLRRKEHEERYRNLIMITSNVKSEIYFMKKNNIQIEGIMKKAYNLYKSLLYDKYPEDLSKTSLDIAKDVHEIKKDYISIINGLAEQFHDDKDNMQMNMKDIISLISNDAEEFIRRNKLKIHVNFKLHDNFIVSNHYYMVTILKNLIYNSIEAIDDKKEGYIFVDVQKQRKICTLFVSDNGEGISKENINYIFNAGFSTKFKEETGDIFRGIGLAHVKGIVDEVFNGDIKVESEVGTGTTITVKLNI